MVLKVARGFIAVSTVAILAALSALTLQPAQAQGQSFKVGVSNGFVGSEWRTQMLDGIREVAGQFTRAGTKIDLVIQSADVDVQGQVQQIRNLISQGVNGIIINPNSQTALNPVIKEATDAGIKVVVVDQEVTAPSAVNVAIDQRAWAKDKMDWLTRALNGRGNVVVVNGIDGHPANEAREAGIADSLKAYPNIKVLNTIYGDWDHAKAQQALSAVLAAQPNIDGIFTQDGMGQGVLRALIAAKPAKMPVVSGEAYVGYMKLWTEIKKTNPTFRSYGLANPPGVGASGLRVLVGLMQGRQLRDGVLKGAAKNTIFVRVPARVSDSSLAETLARLTRQGKADTYTMDGFLNATETAALFR